MRAAGTFSLIGTTGIADLTRYAGLGTLFLGTKLVTAGATLNQAIAVGMPVMKCSDYQFPALLRLASCRWLAVALITLLTAIPANAQEIQWRHNLQAAQQEAAQQNKLVLVHFATDWCKPCQSLERFVFCHPRVARLMDQVVIPVKIDAEAHPQLVSQYGIHTVPYDVALTSNGRLVQRRSSPRDTEGYVRMLESLQRPQDQIIGGNQPALEQNLSELEQLMDQQQKKLRAPDADLAPPSPTHFAARPSAGSSRLKQNHMGRQEDRGFQVIPPATGNVVAGQRGRAVENPFFARPGQRPQPPADWRSAPPQVRSLPVAATPANFQQTPNSDQRSVAPVAATDAVDDPVPPIREHDSPATSQPASDSARSRVQVNRFYSAQQTAPKQPSTSAVPMPRARPSQPQSDSHFVPPQPPQPLLLPRPDLSQSLPRATAPPANLPSQAREHRSVGQDQTKPRETAPDLTLGDSSPSVEPADDGTTRAAVESSDLVTDPALPTQNWHTDNGDAAVSNSGQDFLPPTPKVDSLTSGDEQFGEFPFETPAPTPPLAFTTPSGDDDTGNPQKPVEQAAPTNSTPNDRAPVHRVASLDDQFVPQPKPPKTPADEAVDAAEDNQFQPRNQPLSSAPLESPSEDSIAADTIAPPGNRVADHVPTPRNPAEPVATPELNDTPVFNDALDSPWRTANEANAQQMPLTAEAVTNIPPEAIEVDQPQGDFAGLTGAGRNATDRTGEASLPGETELPADTALPQTSPVSFPAAAPMNAPKWPIDPIAARAETGDHLNTKPETVAGAMDAADPSPSISPEVQISGSEIDPAEPSDNSVAGVAPVGELHSNSFEPTLSGEPLSEEGPEDTSHPAAASSPSALEVNTLRSSSPFTSSPVSTTMNMDPESASPVESDGFVDQPSLPSRSESAPQPAQLQMPTPTASLDGNCPVTLIEKAQWVPGDVQFGCLHRKRLYLFVSAEARDRFLADPDRFSPLLAGFDPVIYQQSGKLQPGSIEHGLFMGQTPDQRIVLFASAANREAFQQSPREYLDTVRQAMAKAANQK